MNNIFNREKKDLYQDIFSDITIAGDIETRQPIPSKSSDSPINNRTFFNLESPKEKFFREMKEYERKDGEKAPFVPFDTYWPMYVNMEENQKAWYFYWRSQVRQGNYMDTDLSYLFLYIYELLSKIGWTVPQEGYEKLYAIWSQYKNRFPKLEYYLPDWIFDFTQIYQLKNVCSFENSKTNFKPSIMTDTLIDRHTEDVPLKLSFFLIDALADYKIQNSKFYKDGNQELIEEAIPRVVAFVDLILRRKRQRGILEIYGPSRTKKQIRSIYGGALCPQANEKITIIVKAYSTNQTLRTFFNELIRYGENILREIKGYRGRLRGITLDKEIAKQIEWFLRKEYDSVQKSKKIAKEVTEEALKKSSKEEIVLDFESIHQLRQQSDMVRAALEVEEITGENTYSRNENDNRIEKGYFKEEKNSCKVEKNRFKEEGNNCIIEKNRFKEEESNCIIEKNYFKEENSCEIGKNCSKMEEFDISVLSGEIKEWMELLLPEQKEIVSIILTSDNPKEDMEKVAECNMTMPEILIDDINALAIQLLGDIMIDTLGERPIITEEYVLPLKKAVKKVVL